ncbi:MAG: hypothetical protein RMJ07_05775 [Nitrososphaerota archaeon]|nr:hypothetical protein [Candidatus Bathyarchaeota archaeon]MDW8049168.1 hypothetical protein [Nitrososphaerota archaeon]
MNKFGFYSGETVSPIYADIHALGRLWSLGLSFTCISALISSRPRSRNLNTYLVAFTLGFIQIASGHIPELLLIGFSLFAAILLFEYDTKRLATSVAFSTLLSLLIIVSFPFIKESLILLFSSSFTDFRLPH